VAGPRLLGAGDSQAHATAFREGQADRFVLHAPDLGRLEQAVVAHDNAGGRPARHLLALRVQDGLRGETTTFPCRK